MKMIKMVLYEKEGAKKNKSYKTNKTEALLLMKNNYQKLFLSIYIFN